MSVAQRELIKEYLYAGFSAGDFSRIEEGRTPLENYTSPESARFLSLWRDDERYLVVVHADTGYRPSHDQLVSLFRDMAQRRIACVSVFDDTVFFNLDENLEGRPRANRVGGRKGRIRLLGLERLMQTFGPVVYYKHKDPRVQVIEYSDAVADYSDSDRVPTFRKRDTQLLTVKNPTNLATYKGDFTLSIGKESKGILPARFVAASEYISPRELKRLRTEAFSEETPKEDEYVNYRARFFLDEMDGGADLLDQLTAADLDMLVR